MAKILVVDDDPSVRSSLERALRLQGYEVVTAADGLEGLGRLAESPDLVIFDVMMPKLDGLEACRELRARGLETPVLILTAREEVSDRVAGLDAGADDYLVKPFALEELFARLRALLRRQERVNGDEEFLSFAGVEMDLGAHTASRDGESLDLTKTEFNLLELFLRNPKQALTRSIIFERVWGYDFGRNSNSLDVYVGYLRKKLEAGGKPRLIQTVRGIGFALREEQ